jgi:hypothetical protein
VQYENPYKENTEMTKLLTVSTLALTLALFVGCGKETDPAKTPGAQTAPADENTFTLTLPRTATDLEPGGEANNFEISANRGENVKGEIALSFPELPNGITIEPASPRIPAGADKVEVAVSAAADAPAGTHSIKVMGESEGKQAEGMFDVKVDEPDND